MKTEFSILTGMTLTQVKKTYDELIFFTNEGRTFKLHHDQDCCENVYIESVVGDLDDLIGTPILLAEESSGETPAGYKFQYEPESCTWTFYKIATRKGYVDVRWLGESNGYYSESVSFTEVTQ